MRLTSLDEATERLRLASDLPSVQEIVRSAARAVSHSHGATLVLREDDQCFYADEDAISPLWKGQRFPLTQCISGWAMLHDEMVVVPDITQDPRIPLDAYRPTFVKSLAMVPIGHLSPIGAIGTYWAYLHIASSAEMEGLAALAGSAYQALQRVRIGADASRLAS